MQTNNGQTIVTNLEKFQAQEIIDKDHTQSGNKQILQLQDITHRLQVLA